LSAETTLALEATPRDKTFTDLTMLEISLSNTERSWAWT